MSLEEREARAAYPSDAIVVLGGGVKPDGTLPVVGRTRVHRAVELYRRGIAPRIIFTGRCGLMDDDPPVTEAAAMAEMARGMGLPDEALLLEEEAKDTLGNAYFVREQFLEPNGWRSIRVVTSDFHMSRAAWVFRKILGPGYDFSFMAAASGLSPHELIVRALEECKITIFLNEWLEALEDADEHAIDRLMSQEHPGYADAPLLTHEEMRRRLAAIDEINRAAGTQHWLTSAAPGGWNGRTERRGLGERRGVGPSRR
ncbi:MAG TPA: YdcF family protein [Longimicrobiaceae bacterium]|nr:YdcF family protein [Longimicrobiaceae bacterium]